MINQAAPALPDSAPVIYEMWDHANPDAAFCTSIVDLDVRGPDLIPEDETLAAERGPAAWHRSNDVLTLGDFVFGAHLLVSGAQNTVSGKRELLESFIKIDKRSATWPSYPHSDTYNQKTESVFPGPFKIIARNRAGQIVHTFEMHDGLPINDPSLHQGYPTETKPLRPKVSVGNTLPWWNEEPRQSASLRTMFAGITEAGMRPSQTKSHYSCLSCEPPITGGYNRNSINSLGDIWRTKPWAMPKGGYWPDPATADPYANYVDIAQDGRSAFMGSYVMGYMYEPGSYTTHVKYTAPGGPRYDRSFFPSQIALWMTEPDGCRLDGGVRFSTIAYQYALAYGNHPNRWSPKPETGCLWATDAELIASKNYFVGNYYGDGGPDGPNAIRVNAAQRDGTDARHFDIFGDMPYHGWGWDSLHNGVNAGDAAIAMQSAMMLALSKADTACSFMMHGGPDSSNREAYIVRNMAWEWKHHVVGYKVGADHPLAFKRRDILDRFCQRLEVIHREFVVPCMSGERPEGMYEFYEGLVRFGQPLTRNGGQWQCHGGGLAYYLGGVMVYMKQSGMWGEIQERGGKPFEALLFTLRCAMTYAFGMFAQTKATMFSNPSFPADFIFADKTGLPADWAEWSKVIEGDRPFKPSDDASIYPLMTFIQAMWDYFPEIDHPLKQAAHEAVLGYEQQVSDRVAALAGDPGAQRDADFNYRCPGNAPLRPPAKVGPGMPVKLPEPPRTAAPIVTPPPGVTDALPDGEWEKIGEEGARLLVAPGTSVAYGIGRAWVIKVITGEFSASNGYFGIDPAPGIRKFVFQLAAAVPVPELDPTPVPVPTPVPTPTPEPVPTPTPNPEPIPVPAAQEATTRAILIAGMKAALETAGFTVTKKD